MKMIGIALAVGFLAAGCSSSKLAYTPTECQQNISQSLPPPGARRLNIVSCLQDPIQITVWHTPLYNAAEHYSTITARAASEDLAIDEIEIEIVVGTMSDCSGVLAFTSQIPCRVDAQRFARICSYLDSPASNESDEKTCKAVVHIGDRSLVTYRAIVRDKSAEEFQSREITYSGGAPLDGVLAPIWWHTGTPQGYLNIDRLNLGLFPDNDYDGNYAKFSDDVTNLVQYSFFNSGQSYSRQYSLNRHRFDLWAAPFGADAEPDCYRSFSGSAADAAAFVDGKAIVHTTPFDDCAAIALGGQGSIYSGSYDASWLLVHESAHFLFGLGDEYSGGGNISISDPKNVFESDAECTASAPNVGATIADCRIINSYVSPLKWRIDQGLNETMQDRFATSDFRNSADQAIANLFSRCINMQCY